MISRNNPPKAIAFDAFGTLMQIGQSRSPYLKLMKWLKDNGRKPKSNDASVIMSNYVDLAELAQIFGRRIPEDLLQELHEDLEFELQTIKVYEDVIPTLLELKRLGFKLALCSNLAKPYGKALSPLLPYFDVSILSYKVGEIKPNTQIYNILIERLGCQMSDVLFIGDHPYLDVEKPLELGMSAKLIDRKTHQTIQDVLSSIINLNHLN